MRLPSKLPLAQCCELLEVVASGVHPSGLAGDPLSGGLSDQRYTMEAERHTHRAVMSGQSHSAPAEADPAAGEVEFF
ncbi:MAG: hypothetical protein ABI693_22665 [Bryobacteraceae bacterium]